MSFIGNGPRTLLLILLGVITVMGGLWRLLPQLPQHVHMTDQEKVNEDVFALNVSVGHIPDPNNFTCAELNVPMVDRLPEIAAERATVHLQDWNIFIGKTLMNGRNPEAGRHEGEGETREQHVCSSVLSVRNLDMGMEISISSHDKCRLHNFSVKDMRKCFVGTETRNGRKLLLIGDSRVRFLYNRMSDVLKTAMPLQNDSNCINTVPAWYDPEDPYVNKCPKYTHCEGERTFWDTRMTVQQKWRPVLDEEMFSLIHQQIAYCEERDNLNCPGLVVIGTVLHTIARSRATRSGLEQYRTNLTSLVPLLEKLVTMGTMVVWKMDGPIMPENFSYQKYLRNDVLLEYSKVAFGILSPSKVFVWSSVVPLVMHHAALCRSLSYPANQPFGCKDALHPGNIVYTQKVTMLMHFYCHSTVKYLQGECCH